jgi:NAD(P)-dependent dehydrogenase (short-subunit alcohol dehydrogenase family)
VTQASQIVTSLTRHTLPSLAERVVLVTGAGQGLGRVIALACARQGATVILHGRTVDKLEAVYDEIEAVSATQSFILPLDLATATSTDFAALTHAIQTQAGRLDGIVHCAAMLTKLSPLEQQTLEQWLAMLRVNLAAPFALTRACLPLLRAAPDASVVFTLDSRGQQPKAYWGGYAVAKAGLAALLAILADEWENRPNLRVNAVVPGPIASPMRRQSHPGETSAEQTAVEELVPLYLHLLGGQNKADSGTIWHADEWRNSRQDCRQ